MQFDAALAAQETFKQAEAKFISHWDTAIEFEDACSSCVESTVRGVYEGLPSMGSHYSTVHSSRL
jgi:hypothetical protein